MSQLLFLKLGLLVIQLPLFLRVRQLVSKDLLPRPSLSSLSPLEMPLPFAYRSIDYHLNRCHDLELILLALILTQGNISVCNLSDGIVLCDGMSGVLTYDAL